MYGDRCRRWPDSRICGARGAGIRIDPVNKRPQCLSRDNHTPHNKKQALDTVHSEQSNPAPMAAAAPVRNPTRRCPPAASARLSRPQRRRGSCALTRWLLPPAW